MWLLGISVTSVSGLLGESALDKALSLQSQDHSADVLEELATSGTGEKIAQVWGPQRWSP